MKQETFSDVWMMIEQRKNFFPMLLAALDPFLDGWRRGCRFFQQGELFAVCDAPPFFLDLIIFLFIK